MIIGGEMNNEVSVASAGHFASSAHQILGFRFNLIQDYHRYLIRILEMLPKAIVHFLRLFRFDPYSSDIFS